MSDPQMKEMIVLSSPSGAGDGGASLPDLPPAPREVSDRQRHAERLRAQGWSYRRIAEELHVSYILVSRWLEDGGTAQPATSRADLPVRDTAPAKTAATPKTAKTTEGEADNVLAAQFSAFERYVREVIGALEQRHDTLLAKQDELLRAWEAERAEAKERESALHAQLEDERARAAETLARVQTDVARLRAEIEAQLDRTSEAEADTEPDDDEDADPFSFGDEDRPAADADTADPFTLDEGSSGDSDPFSFGKPEKEPSDADPFAFDDTSDGEEPPVPEAAPKKRGLFFWRR